MKIWRHNEPNGIHLKSAAKLSNKTGPRQKIVFIVVISLLYSTSVFGDSCSVLRLGTATKGGNYYNLGLSIKSLLKNNNFNYQIEVIPTEGSTDNINKLLNKEIDFAIVQNDIAFFAENGLHPFDKPVDDLYAIMSIYHEPIFIISNQNDINNISQLSNKKVNVGPLASGLIVDAKIILNSCSLWESIIKFNYKPSEAIEELLNENIHATFINNINQETQNYLDEGLIYLLTLSNNQINCLINTYPYFDKYSIVIKGENINTVTVKSILVCRSEQDINIVYQMTKIIYDNFFKLTFPSTNIKTSNDEVICSISLNKWHDGSNRFFREIGLSHPPNYLNYLWYLCITIVSLILLVVIADLSIFSLSNKRLRISRVNSKTFRIIQLLNLKIIQNKYILVFLIMFTVYLSCMSLVQHFEHKWAIENNEISVYDSQPFLKNLLWLFVFGGSSYHGGLFPHSSFGKIIVTIIPIVGLGGFITIVGLITSDHIKRRLLEAKGMGVIKVKNHILLCGWNNNMPFLIKNLIHENITSRKPIVILANLDDDMPIEKYRFDPKMVTYVKGDSTDKSDLERANLKDADIAMIVSDANSSDPDARNILKILTIEKYGHELELSGKRKNRDNIYTIAEIQDTHVFQAAYSAYVDEIVSFGHIRSKIFAQAIQNPGTSKFINEILTYNDYNDIYTIFIDRKSKLIGYTFDELLILLRKHKILLLSINIQNHRNIEQIEDKKKKYNLNRTVITNPLSKEENNYCVQEGDLLIVLSQYERTIQDALKSINSNKIPKMLLSEIAKFLS